MNTNEKGNLGLLKIMQDLYSQQYHCFTPFDDYSPVDLIAMSPTGKLFRLQVKYRTLMKTRSGYELPARSVVNGKSVPIDKTLIDGWAVYLSDIDKIIYYPIEKMGGSMCKYLKEDDSVILGDW